MTKSGMRKEDVSGNINLEKGLFLSISLFLEHFNSTSQYCYRTDTNYNTEREIGKKPFCQKRNSKEYITQDSSKVFVKFVINFFHRAFLCFFNFPILWSDTIAKKATQDKTTIDVTKIYWNTSDINSSILHSRSTQKILKGKHFHSPKSNSSYLSFILSSTTYLRFPIILFTLFFLAAFPMFKSQANNYQYYQEYAKTLHHQKRGIVYNPQDIPGASTANPVEVEYYKDPSALESNTKQQASTDSSIRDIRTSNLKKEEFRPTAKQIKRTTNTVTENPESIIDPKTSLPCSDGNCVTPPKDQNPTQDFVKVSTMAHTLREVEKDVKTGNAKPQYTGPWQGYFRKLRNEGKAIKVFTGEVKSCTKAMWGYNNCCASGGWGHNLGASCSSSEHQLKQKKQKKECVHVRTYCSKTFLRKCSVRTEEYCCFDSNLSKILAENTRHQLNIPWDYGGGADCRGFHPEELQRVKFDRIDFSEFAGSIDTHPSSKNTLNKDQIKAQILEQIRGHYEE